MNDETPLLKIVYCFPYHFSLLEIYFQSWNITKSRRIFSIVYGEPSRLKKKSIICILRDFVFHPLDCHTLNIFVVLIRFPNISAQRKKNKVILYTHSCILFADTISRNYTILVDAFFFIILKVFIQFIIEFHKLKSLRVLRINTQEMESKVFSISIKIRSSGMWFCFRFTKIDYV